MSRRRLEIGEHGEIGYVTTEDKVIAYFHYRNAAGRRRRMEASGRSKAAARRLLLQKFDRVMASTGIGVYDHRTTVAVIAEEWHAQVVEAVQRGRRSPRTAALYRHVLDRHILPSIGGLRLSELTVVRMDDFLHGLRRTKGYSVAKLSRSVASGVCGHAVRKGAMPFNPVRDVAALEQDGRKAARALMGEEARRWLKTLDADEEAVRWDLPDLARFMLGTGCRLGETLAVRWEDIDLRARQVLIRRTVLRVPGEGLIAKAPKTEAGVRLLGLPGWLVRMLEARAVPEACSGPVFADSLGGYRDPNNVERAFRKARAETEFDWVVPHTYRKTVATWLDESGASARMIADQLGHSRVSMTQDVYMGRRAVDERAAKALDNLLDERPRDPAADDG
jgi:integrase